MHCLRCRCDGETAAVYIVLRVERVENRNMKKAFLFVLSITAVFSSFPAVNAQEMFMVDPDAMEEKEVFREEHFMGESVFMVDPDAIEEKETVQKEDPTDPSIVKTIYDSNGKQIYPPPAVISMDDEGYIHDTECSAVNPLSDNEYFVDLLGEISAKDHVKGPENAVMTLIEYADFQCPGCSFAYKDLRAYAEKHPDEVRIVYRHYPLSMHELALPAAHFAEAAGIQGYFFEAADLMYENQSSWSSKSEAGFEKWFLENIESVAEGIDTEKLLQDYNDEKLHENLLSDLEKAVDSGLIASTPSIMLNYSPFANSFSESTTDKWLEIFRFKDKLFTECPEFQIDLNKKYRAEVETTKGTFEIELYAENAPLAVSNFIFLSENGWYDDMPISAVVHDYAVQFGDPSASGYLNAGYTFLKETNETDFKLDNGYVTLFEDAEDKNSSTTIIWLDTYKYYVDMFTESGDLSKEDVVSYAESLSIQDITKHTVIGKITEETYAVAASLGYSDTINSVSIRQD